MHPIDPALAADALAKQLRALATRRQQCIGQAVMLEALGCIRATMHWKAGKYLYLIHPTDSCGQRTRQYIGADPIKIKNAEATLARQKAVDELKREIARIDADTSKAFDCIAYALRTVGGIMALDDLVTDPPHQVAAGVTNQHDFW